MIIKSCKSIALALGTFFVGSMLLSCAPELPGFVSSKDKDRRYREDINLSHVSGAYDHHLWLFAWADKQDDPASTIYMKASPSDHDFSSNCMAPEAISKAYNDKAYSCVELKESSTVEYYGRKGGWFDAKETAREARDFEIIDDDSQDVELSLTGEEEHYEHLESICRINVDESLLSLEIQKLVPKSIARGYVIRFQASLDLPAADETYIFNSSTPEDYVGITVTKLREAKNEYSMTLYANHYQTNPYHSPGTETLDGSQTNPSQTSPVPQEGWCIVTIEKYAVNENISGQVECQNLQQVKVPPVKLNQTIDFATHWSCDTYR